MTIDPIVALARTADSSTATPAAEMVSPALTASVWSSSPATVR